MKSALVPLFALVLLAASPAPVPTPTSDPHTYDDPAMHFRAPAAYLLAGRQQVDSTKLEKPTTVAIWVKFPGQPNQRTLQISLQPYSGRDIDQFETNLENDLREQVDGVFVSQKQHFSLKNGMPAMFMAISSGSGFNAIRVYQVIWFDGLRGVTISLQGRLGEVTESEAKETMSDVTAVAYPVGRI